MKIRTTTIVALAALACSACSKKPEERRFRLVGDLHNKVPVELQRDSSCTILLKSGVLRFRERRYDSHFHIVRACPGVKDSTITDPGIVDASYTLVGDTLTFQDSFGQPSGMGLRRGDTIKVTGPTHTLIYIRE